MGFIISLLIIIGALAIFVLLTDLKIVRETQAMIVERLGKFKKVWYKGIHFLVPIIDRGSRVELKEQIADYPPQPVITKDNVTMQIDTVVFWKVFDPKLFKYSIQNPYKAIEVLCTTTLRNLIGELDLDETLTSRDVINGKLTKLLDVATDEWGIKVNRVEVKNILPPKDIREAMEKQMRAERERREAILKAEGEKKSAILEAEGIKESTILKAEAAKAAVVAEAEGKARALELMYNATAEAIKVINSAKPSEEYIKLESFKALEKVANGQATKLIVPSDLQNITSTVATIKETLK